MSTKKQVIARINAAMRRIADERDRLRELIAEAESISDDCDEACDDLKNAADALSRLL